MPSVTGHMNYGEEQSRWNEWAKQANIEAD